jgi:SAM-dependent methyltransferase
MSEWTAGYVADILYTYGYYNELNPERVKLAFLRQGLVHPEIHAACELGFGQGLSVNLHAAASVTQWYGTDFNPAQAGFAQELAQAAGSGARLYDEAFADFAHRSDLPDFDYIGLHGIWSWISDENRAVIVDFIRRKLKVGGVLYISYNTLPGWAAFAPMRHLMTEHAEVLGSEGRGIVNRIDGAIDFAEKLLATNPIFSRANPQVGDRLQNMKKLNRHYLAHEYFNRDWHPMHFATMADWLGGAKVQYACSAYYLGEIADLDLTAEQQAFLQEIPDRMFRESVRDFMTNQQFRRDYWVKGARRLSGSDQIEAVKAQKTLLVSHRPDISLKVSGALGEAQMSEQIYAPILDALADHKALSIGEIEQAVKDRGIALGQIVEAVTALIGAGHAEPAQPEETMRKAKPQTERLNAHLRHVAGATNDIGVLASPVTGGGVPVPRLEQLFLTSIDLGATGPADWAGHAWRVLDAQGHKVITEGKTLETAEENLAELTSQAKTFAEKRLPALRALGVA